MLMDEIRQAAPNLDTAAPKREETDDPDGADVSDDNGAGNGENGTKEADV